MSNRIIINVSGGVVQAVYADNPKGIEVILFDEDNIREETGKSRNETGKDWKELTKDATNIF